MELQLTNSEKLFSTLVYVESPVTFQLVVNLFSSSHLKNKLYKNRIYLFSTFILNILDA